VLLDEPLSGLDPRGIRSARAAIAELRSRGTAVVLSSHLLELIEALADRILIIDGGKKVFEGTLADARAAVRLSEHDSLEEIFFAATGEGRDGPAAGSGAAGTSAAPVEGAEREAGPLDGA
jgi:ABC-2 type transport system ATP-binding protein